MTVLENNGIGMLLGLAVGDALGTTLEFTRRLSTNQHKEMIGGGPFDLAAGQWTDDTSMAIGLTHSLLEHGAFIPLSVLTEWAAWYTTGKYSCTGTCFDIGRSTMAALDAFIANPTVVPTISESSLGNAPLMRNAPVVLFAKTESEAKELSSGQGKLTHANDAADSASILGMLCFNAIHSGFDPNMIPKRIRTRSRDQVSSSGFHKHTLEAALWAVSHSGSFEEVLIQAVNLGDDADTVGAVSGQLAGAIYGYESIPVRWLEKLAWKDELVEMAKKLIENSQKERQSKTKTEDRRSRFKWNEGELT